MAIRNHDAQLYFLKVRGVRCFDRRQGPQGGRRGRPGVGVDTQVAGQRCRSSSLNSEMLVVLWFIAFAFACLVDGHLPQMGKLGLLRQMRRLS